MGATGVTDRPGAGIAIERVVDAPRDLVWQAWTDPAHRAQWWVPEGSIAARWSIDLRTGGRLLVCSSTAEHEEACMAGVFYEIDPPYRLVCGDYVTYPGGKYVLPVTRLTSVTLEDLGDGRTKMTLR